MSLKHHFLTGLLACLALPAWAAPPAIDELLQQVWESHPGIQAAQSAVEAAQALSTAAGKPIYNPELEVDAERTAVNTLSIGINQTIDWGDKRGAQRQMGDSGIRIAQAELAARRLQVASEVLTALASYQTAQEQRQLATRFSELMGQLVETTEQRYAAGDLGQLDVALARVAFSESRMQVARRTAEVSRQQASLVAASGLRLSQWPSLPNPPPAPPASPQREALLAELPQLIAQQARIANARGGIELARATRKADPTLGLRGGAEESDLLLGLNFSMPLNVRNTYTAEVTAASQQAVQEEKILQDLHRLAASRFDGSLSVYRLTHRAWLQWQDAGQSNLARQLKLVQRIWEAGELSTTDYLLQTGQNINTQITAAELKGELRLAWVAWLKASGQIGGNRQTPATP
ncbi:MAG TPA: TolC family protein [Gammaproteobacteria bacterium]|nr:TolC family protein [Gammaproteobacteria bacterium]